MKYPYTIVKNILRTEKGTRLLTDNKYLFEVDKRANKIEIKKAIEEIYNVKVQKVNSVSLTGKIKRVRYKPGRTPNWKKAIVTLKPGHTIEIT
jgi:large subunit ribosomal protein L23